MPLRVENLTVRVGTTGPAIIEDVSLAVAPGEILGVIGESGSGKTTLANALLGYGRDGAAITAGRVEVAGHDIAGTPPAKLARLRGRVVAHVPADPGAAMNPVMRVGAHLAEAARLLGLPGRGREQIGATLTSVGLPADREFLRRYPHQLSGGQQQRVMLALAFFGTPPLVVLDEPTSALDAITQQGVLAIVRELCTQQRTAAVLISHDLDVVTAVADRALVMYGGRVAELGLTAQVLDHGLHPYTQALRAAMPRGERSDIVGIPGRPPRLSERRPGCLFADRCQYAEPDCHEQVPALTAVTTPVVTPVVSTPVAGTTAGPAAEHLVACLHPRPGTPVATFSMVFESGQGAGDGQPHEGLSAQSMCMRYHQRLVVNQVDLVLRPQGCVALVGESGSGKTTLSQMIAGLRVPTSGTVRLAGTTLASTAHARTADQRRRLQYVFQNPYASLNPRKTVRQILAEPARAFHFADADPAGALDAVALSASVLDERPSALSGGERQRVAIARALLCEPDFMVCDEITSALDVSVQATVVELLGRLQRERVLGLLFVTHNLKLAFSIADHVVVMRSGVVVDSAATAGFDAGERSDYTKELLASMTAED